MPTAMDVIRGAGAGDGRRVERGGGRTRADGDVRELFAGVGRHWGWLLMWELLTALFGIRLLVWPSATIVVIATFLGVYLLVSGIFWIVAAFASSVASTGYRWPLGVSGLFSVLLGLTAFQSIAHSVQILVLLIGYGWIFQGSAQLIEGIADKGTQGRGWAIFGTARRASPATPLGARPGSPPSRS